MGSLLGGLWGLKYQVLADLDTINKLFKFPIKL